MTEVSGRETLEVCAARRFSEWFWSPVLRKLGNRKSQAERESDRAKAVVSRALHGAEKCAKRPPSVITYGEWHRWHWQAVQRRCSPWAGRSVRR